MRKIGIGNVVFKDLVEQDTLFVDKSMLIAEIINNKIPVNLFTRPRRFGKTTNLIMLREFFDIRKKEENKDLFNNLKIASTKYMNTHRGEHPVIFISFKDIKENNYKEGILEVKRLLSRLYREHRYLIDNLEDEDLDEFKSILKFEEMGDYKQSLKFLTKLLYEYDTPIISAYTNDYYEEIISFYRSLYGSCLKDNEYLEKAIITGLNNIEVNSIFSDRMETYFGFTEEEVKDISFKYELI